MKIRKYTVALMVLLLLSITTFAFARKSVQFDDMGDFTGPATYARYGSLNDAVAVIGGDLTSLYINYEIPLTANVVVPSTLKLDFKGTGSIIFGAFNATINGPLNAPIQQIFNENGAGRVILGNNIEKVYAEYWGAVGDNDGTAGNGTDDYVPIQRALDAHRVVELLAKNYRVSTFLSITNPQQELYGQGASWSGYKTALIPDAALNTFVIVEAVTDGGANIHDFAIIGNESLNSLGAIHLEDDGGSGNWGNSIQNMRIVGFLRTGARGIAVESWGTTLRNLYIHSIRRGAGLMFGAGGVTGTTQYFERTYITECDIGVRILATSLGITGINPVFEANVIEILVEALSVTLINPYFEHVNRVNNDGAGSRRSIYVPTVNGIDVDAAISVLTNTPGTGVDAALTIQHMNLQSLDNVASTFIKVSDDATLIIEGGDWNDRITDPTQIVAGPGTTSILTVEDYKDLDISLFPQVRNRGLDRVWSSRRLQTTLLDSDEVDIVATATGTDDGGGDAAFLTDSGEGWPVNGYVGSILYNVTDGSSCVVTSNTATRMDGTLAGGTDNDWDNGDTWTIGTETILADFGVDITTYYSFRVFGRIGDLVVSVDELYVTFINGTEYRIVVHESYDAGTYDNTFALANTGANKLDIVVTNDHATDTVSYQISLIHTALIK